MKEGGEKRDRSEGKKEGSERTFGLPHARELISTQSCTLETSPQCPLLSLLLELIKSAGPNDLLSLPHRFLPLPYSAQLLPLQLFQVGRGLKS
jgi:hypothetical protein